MDYFFCRVHRFSRRQLYGLLIFLDLTHHGSLKSLLDPDPNVILSGYDEKGAEDDKREAEAILDQEEMEIIVLRVCEKEVDVIVGNVEKDETGKEKGGPAR